MKLCLAAPTFHPFYSGASERFRRYFPGFRALGVEPIVFTGTPEPEKAALAGVEPWWEDDPPGRLLPPEEVDGVRVLRVRLPDRGGRRRAASFARALSEYCLRSDTPPDLVQLYTPAVMALPWLHRLARAGVPLVVARTMMPEMSEPGGGVVNRLAHWITTAPIVCDIVGTEAMADAYRSLGIRHRVEVIPHGIDLSRFRPPATGEERSSLRRKLGLPDAADVLLFVGALTARKRVHLLVESWARMSRERPDLHLVLVGPGGLDEPAASGEYGSRLRELMEGANAPGRLHLPGEVKAVEEYYRAADLFVFPSSREGMPNAMVEAMASGLAVVTTAFSGLSGEVGEPGETFVLSEADPAHLARMVESLLRDPARCADLRTVARKWCERHLSVEEAVRRYVEVYRGLVSVGYPEP